MFSHYQKVVAVALTLGAFIAPVHAVTVTFDDVTPDIYGEGDSFMSGNFTFTNLGSVGGVDTTEGLFGLIPPSGNSTQFYYGLNDSHVRMSNQGLGFSLSGFDASFIASTALAPGVRAGKIIVSATDFEGEVETMSFKFARADSDSSTPFRRYHFDTLYNLKTVEFLACSYDAGNKCVNLNDNASQFALDNVVAAAVPEPATYLLMALGLWAVGALRRRD